MSATVAVFSDETRQWPLVSGAHSLATWQTWQRAFRAEVQRRKAAGRSVTVRKLTVERWDGERSHGDR
jgi:hypothetical protein